MKKIKFFLGWIAGVLMTVPFIRGYSAYDVKIVGYSPTETFGVLAVYTVCYLAYWKLTNRDATN